MGCVIIRPDQFGIVSDAVHEVAAFNLVALSKILKSAFMLTEEKSGPFTGMNDWVLSKHDAYALVHCSFFLFSSLFLFMFLQLFLFSLYIYIVFIPF
jgi:hypothetical protein